MDIGNDKLDIGNDKLDIGNDKLDIKDDGLIITYEKIKIKHIIENLDIRSDIKEKLVIIYENFKNDTFSSSSIVELINCSRSSSFRQSQPLVLVCFEIPLKFLFRIRLLKLQLSLLSLRFQIRTLMLL